MAVQRVKSKEKSGSSGGTSAAKARVGRPPSAPKVLRIGIIQGGRIVEERIIRKRETVTVGQSERNTFVVVSSALPSRFDMFETKGGNNGYTLQFTAAMKGRVSIDGEVQELKDLRKNGQAKKKGKVYRLPMDDNARGKLVVGDSTILFQFVAPPPIQPRPQLPAAARGGLFRNVEWFITSLWLISLILHTGALTYLEMTDWPVVSRWEKYMQLQELITQADVTLEKKSEEDSKKGPGDKAEENKEEKKEEADKKKTKKKEKETPKESPEELARKRAEKRAEIAEQLAERGINKIIGSLGGTGEGALFDVLGQGDVGADQDALLKQVAGVGVATGDNRSLRGPAGGKGGGEVADIGQVKMKGGDAAVKTGGAGQERKVKVTVKRKNASAVDGTGALNPQEVNKVIGRRMGAIKGCYERALRRDPNLKGKLVVRFTIAGSGRVTAARIVENDLTPEVGNCVVSRFKAFRFPQPDGGSLTMESPFMFMPAN
jgi:outer membrane biosynthesis protein TonB